MITNRKLNTTFVLLRTIDAGNSRVNNQQLKCLVTNSCRLQPDTWTSHRAGGENEASQRPAGSLLGAVLSQSLDQGLMAVLAGPVCLGADLCGALMAAKLGGGVIGQLRRVGSARAGHVRAVGGHGGWWF